MITPQGYSKDLSIKPDAICITFGKEMMIEQGGYRNFIKNFLETVNSDEDYWMHKCKNLPSVEVDEIYIIVLNRLWGKVYCGGYRKPGAVEVIGYTATGAEQEITWNHIILSGPFEKCHTKISLKGFQGFRYCTKLF